MQRSPGFFGTLFDVSFQHFLTLRFVKVIYVLLLVLIVGSGLGGVIFGLLSAVRAASGQQALVAILGALVVTPLVTLLWLCLVRVVLESVVVFFRLNETATDLLYSNRAIVRHLVAPSRPGSTRTAAAPATAPAVAPAVVPAEPPPTEDSAFEDSAFENSAFEDSAFENSAFENTAAEEDGKVGLSRHPLAADEADLD